MSDWTYKHIRPKEVTTPGLIYLGQENNIIAVYVHLTQKLQSSQYYIQLRLEKSEILKKNINCIIYSQWLSV